MDIFNKVGIQHNDLHLGNLFVSIRKNNNIFQRSYQNISSRQYIFTSHGYEYEVLLEDIGLDIRIYDFDRSVKFYTNDFPYEFDNRWIKCLSSKYQKIFFNKK